MPTVTKKDFQQFYQTYFDKVYRFVFFRVGGDAELAQDLVSEIFMKALQHFADYDTSKSTSAWIMTISRNHLANHWRDTKKTEPLPGERGEDEQQSDHLWLASALTQSHKENSRRETEALVEKLGEAEREIVTFHYLLGYSYAEIGEIKSMSEGAVKVAAHRAIKKLRSLL